MQRRQQQQQAHGIMHGLMNNWITTAGQLLLSLLPNAVTQVAGRAAVRRRRAAHAGPRRHRLLRALKPHAAGARVCAGHAWLAVCRGACAAVCLHTQPQDCATRMPDVNSSPCRPSTCRPFTCRPFICPVCVPGHVGRRLRPLLAARVQAAAQRVCERGAPVSAPSQAAQTPTHASTHACTHASVD